MGGDALKLKHYSILLYFTMEHLCEKVDTMHRAVWEVKQKVGLASECLDPLLQFPSWTDAIILGAFIGDSTGEMKAKR